MEHCFILISTHHHWCNIKRTKSKTTLVLAMGLNHSLGNDRWADTTRWVSTVDVTSRWLSLPKEWVYYIPTRYHTQIQLAVRCTTNHYCSDYLLRNKLTACIDQNVRDKKIGGRLFMLDDFPSFNEPPAKIPIPEALKHVF